MGYVNLLQETLDALKNNDKTPEDVVWVGIRNHIFEDKESMYKWDEDKNDLVKKEYPEIAISWDEFRDIANFEYDCGYGLVYIESDLVVVGEDWWLERHEYDGCEEWKFKNLPKRPSCNDKDLLKKHLVIKYV